MIRSFLVAGITFSLEFMARLATALLYGAFPIIALMHVMRTAPLGIEGASSIPILAISGSVYTTFVWRLTIF